MSTMAVLARCLPGCDGQPAPILCTEHFEMLPLTLRSALIDEWNKLQPPAPMTARLATLLKMASRNLEARLKGAGKVHDIGTARH